MLFVAEYDLEWDALEAAVAKRLEWPQVCPDGFRFVGEYIWNAGTPPLRGVVIIDADSVDALNHFVLHYGPTLTLRIHPASDVVSAMAGLGGGAPVKRRRTRTRK